jgi:hypothetical protein
MVVSGLPRVERPVSDLRAHYLAGAILRVTRAYSRSASSPSVFAGRAYTRLPCIPSERSGCAEARRPHDRSVLQHVQASCHFLLPRLMASLWPLASRRVARTLVNATHVSVASPLSTGWRFLGMDLALDSDFTSGFGGVARRAARVQCLGEGRRPPTRRHGHGVVRGSTWPQPPRPRRFPL